MKRINKLNKREKKLTFEEREACSGRGYVVSEKYLGGGAAGKVFLAEPKEKKIQQNPRLIFLAKSNRKVQVAVKIVPVDLGCYYVRKVSKYLTAEVANMNVVFGEPNILKLLDVFIECKRIFLVLEYASRGSLKTYFHRKVSQEGRRAGGKWMDESEARFIFRQMVLGLHALHTCNIAHRDLKLENVLLMENGDVKLCDFGFSVKQPALDSNEQNVRFAFREMRSVTTCGTPAFMAPEILNCRGGYNAMHGDLWSMGVVLFTLVNGRYPFPGKTVEEVTRQYEMTKARSMKFRNGVSEGACDLIKRLLNRNPVKRLRTCEILQHPWLSETTNDLTSADLSVSVEDCIQAKNDPIFRFQEKVVRSYLLQRADLLDSCKESLSRHHVAASVQAQFGVAIPLPNPDGRPVNEIWRLCARQNDGDDKISDDIDEGDEPGCGATNLRCEWLKPGSCSTEDLKRVVTGLPLTNAWRRARAKTNYYPRMEIEKCLALFNTVHLSDSPKRARRVWVKANGRSGTSLPHHHRPIFVNGVRMICYFVLTQSSTPS